MTDPQELLQRVRSVAVVGCSATPGKDAHDVPLALLDRYEVFPVNPRADAIFGRRSYARLADVPGPVDLVNVFRPAQEAPAIAREAVEAGAKALWLQLGIESDEARRVAEEAGLAYVEDRCIRTELARLQRARRRPD